LAKIGITPEKLTGAIRKRLSNIRNDNVFQPLAELAVASRMGGVEFSDLVTHLNSLSSEAEQVAAVDEARARYAPVLRSTAGGRLSLPQDVVRLRMAARLLRNVNADHLNGDLDRVDPDFRKIVAREVIESVSTLVAAAATLKSHVA
jgi:hypothetical protein